jgi:hypothetical protein
MKALVGDYLSKANKLPDELVRFQRNQMVGVAAKASRTTAIVNEEKLSGLIPLLYSQHLTKTMVVKAGTYI